MTGGATLIITRAGKPAGEYRIDRERITLGRHPGNVIQLDDPAVSARHALIVTLASRGRDSILEDLGSTNGTLVNGQEVSKHLLRSGDAITIGNHRLDYRSETIAGSGMDKTVVIRERPAAAADGVAEATLRILDGPQAGEEIGLTRPITPIGVQGGERAIIERRRGDFFVTRLWGPGAALRLNGAPLGHRRQVLGNGDVIEINGQRHEFLLY